MKIPFHLWVAISNWGTRIITAILQLITLPLLTRALGHGKFAAYSVIISLVGWIALLDMGVGNALQNYISEARAKHEEASFHIAAAFLICVATFLAGLVILWIFSPLMSRFLFSKMLFIPLDTGRKVIFLAGVFFLFNAMGTIGIKMLYALSKGVHANLAMLGWNSLSFILLLFVVTHASQDAMLIDTVAAYAAPMGIVGLSIVVFLFLKYAKWDRSLVRSSLREVYVRSRGFWFFAVLSAAVLNVDYLIMSQTVSAVEIAKYNVLYRIFWVAVSLYSGLLTATWPVCAELLTLGKWKRVNSLLKKYLWIAIVGLIVLVIVTIFLMPQLLPYLMKDKKITVPVLTIALFGCYVSLRIWTDTFAMALQSINDTSIFLRWVPLQALVSVTAQWFLSKLYGLNGILLGLILSFLFTVAWVLPRRLNKHMLEEAQYP